MAFSTENFYKTCEEVRKRIPYKICIKTINPEDILLRSNINDLNETTRFVEAYEAVTYSHFKIMSTKGAENSLVCRRKWICNHSAVSGVNEKCPASINILIKKVNRQNTLRDSFLRRNPPHAAVIKINSNHNHPLMTPLAPYKLVKVNNGVKECFYEYFKKGYFGARAKRLHEQYLQKARFYSFGDRSMNPTLPAIFTLYNNWLKMKGSIRVDTDHGSSGSLQIPAIQKDGYSEVTQSSQNFDKIINMDDMLSKLKKEPEDDYTPRENIVIEAVEDIHPVLNIKQEIIDEDEDEDDGLPVISSYGSVVTEPVWAPPVLTPQPIVAAKAEPIVTIKTEPIVTTKAEAIDTAKAEPIVTTNAEPRIAKSTQNIAAVVKGLQPTSSQVVVYDASLNTYKVVKCLAVNAGTYSASQYNSYLPNTRISFQKP